MKQAGILAVVASIIFGVSYYLTKRVRGHFAEVIHGTRADDDYGAWVYASVITLLFAVIYVLFLKDINNDNSFKEDQHQS